MTVDAEVETAESAVDSRLWLKVILAAALVSRLTAAVVLDQYLSRNDRLFLIEGDANGYWHLAGNIVSGSDYAIHTPPRYVLRTPGFPLLLAGCRLIAGDNLLVARCVLAVIGTLCCLLTFLLAKQLKNDRVALIAAAWVALNPIHIGNSVLILSETWFAFWMLVTLLLISKQLQPPDGPADSLRIPLLQTACIGAATAVTTLVRPGFILWLPITVLAVLTFEILDGRRHAIPGRPHVWRQPLMKSAAIAMGFLVIVAPWALRNYSVTGQVVFTSLWSGPSLYDGLNPNANGRSDMTFFDNEKVMERMTEFEMNEHYKDRAWEFVRSQPVEAISLVFPKAKQFLQPIPNALQSRNWVTKAACLLIWLSLFPGVFLAVLQRSNPLRDLFLTAGPFCLFLAVHMVFVGSVRYRLPLEFPLVILSSCGWVNAITRKKRN